MGRLIKCTDRFWIGHLSSDFWRLDFGEKFAFFVHCFPSVAQHGFWRIFDVFSTKIVTRHPHKLFLDVKFDFWSIYDGFRAIGALLKELRTIWDDFSKKGKLLPERLGTTSSRTTVASDSIFVSVYSPGPIESSEGVSMKRFPGEPFLSDPRLQPIFDLAWYITECDSDWKHVPDCAVWTIQYKAWCPEVPQSDKIGEMSINQEYYSSKMLWWDDPLKAQNVNRKLFRDYKIKTALPQWVLCRGTLRGPEYSFLQIENYIFLNKII